MKPVIEFITTNKRIVDMFPPVPALMQWRVSAWRPAPTGSTAVE